MNLFAFIKNADAPFVREVLPTADVYDPLYFCSTLKSVQSSSVHSDLFDIIKGRSS